jgi:prephenate dehydrogenase
MEVDFPSISSDKLSTIDLAIVGLGLMGGSFGLALRGCFKSIIGYDIDPYAVQRARVIGAIDTGGTDPHEVLPNADVIVYALPVEAIVDSIHQLPDYHSGNPVIFDLGSTKNQIINAMDALPERFDPIGGHPMCGKETSGIDNADSDLYYGAPFALIPLQRTSSHARELSATIVRTIGAKVLWLDASTHDAWVAKTSHLPYLLSSVLASMVSMNAIQLSGSGLKSMTRLAGSNKTMMMDVIRSNRENLSKEINKFRMILELVHTALENDRFEEIENIINYGRVTYHALHQKSLKEKSDEVDLAD